MHSPKLNTFFRQGKEPKMGACAEHMDAAGIPSGDQMTAIAATEFLLRQASKIPVSKLAPRLTPVGLVCPLLQPG